MSILVTGGAGYVGSHAVLALAEAGEQVVVVDDLSNGHRWAVREAPLEVGDIRDGAFMDAVLRRHRVEAVLHFAAVAEAGRSMVDPLSFYDDNVVGTVRLLQAMRRAGVGLLVFSSTSATYGEPRVVPIPEEHPQEPVNAYGDTKLAVERALRWCEEAYGLRTAALRYFNAAGAHPSGVIGEDHEPETHLIPNVLYAALGRTAGVRVFGDDYETPDGTCIRDYVHVSDLADAHVAALRHLRAGGDSLRCNLGNGAGFSVRQVVEVAREVTGEPIAAVVEPRRPGDPARLVASSERARQVLGWTPRYASLHDIVGTAWAWHRAHHG